VKSCTLRHYTRSRTILWKITSSAPHGPKSPTWCGIFKSKQWSIILHSWLNRQPVLANHVLFLSNGYLEKHEGLEKPQAAYYILNIRLKIQSDVHRAAVEEQKELPARGLPLNLACMVQSLQLGKSLAPANSSIPPRQHQLILVCWRPLWGPLKPPVGVTTCNEVIYPSVLPVGLSTFLLHGPCHFRPPNGGPVLSLHIHDPLPVPRGPSAEDPACSERDLPSWWTAVGLSMLKSWGPHSL
jgi:hypothetical protein